MARACNGALRQLVGAALHVSAVAEATAGRTGSRLAADVPQIADLIRAAPDTLQDEVISRMMEEGTWFGLAPGATFEDMVLAALAKRA